MYVSSHNALLRRRNIHWSTTWHHISVRQQGLHSNTEGSNSQADDQCMYPPTTRYCGDETYTGQQHGITYQCDNRVYTRTRKAVTARLMTSVCILPQRVIAATKHTLVNNMASHISATTGSTLEHGRLTVRLII